MYDIGNQDGIDYLVMEYLEGETLAHRLKKGPLPLDQTLRYAVEIADAPAYTHRHGVVHRDLKPGNIILVKSGAKVLDYGLAKVATVPRAEPGETSTMTEEGVIVGTLQYMAPEQLEAKEANACTDIFAFGAVLYEMVTGKKAFEGQSRAGLITAILEHCSCADDGAATSEPAGARAGSPNMPSEESGRAVAQHRGSREGAAMDRGNSLSLHFLLALIAQAKVQKVRSLPRRE